MKKMLFGLLALSLSASIFAAEKTETATMQVQAQLEVVPATADLVIENLTDAGGWNVVAGPITFDHGRVVAGETAVPTPVINENFRVRRGDKAVFGGTVDGTLTVKIGTATEGISLGELLASGGEGVIAHQFGTSSPTVKTSKDATEVPFNIESKVDKLTGKETAGVYRRSETVTVTLTTTTTP